MDSYRTLEQHVKKICSNCRKKKNDEELRSFFEGSKHYVSWTCDNCGNDSWWQTTHHSSGVPHDRA